MGVGSFTYNPVVPPLSFPAVQIGCFFFNTTSGYTWLPNVQCLEIQQHDGQDPPSARFRYVVDILAQAQGFPSQIQNLWPLNLQTSNQYSPYIVTPASRIVVLAFLPDSSWRVLFDGFARMPQGDVGERQQDVTFTAHGVAIRAYDYPVAGRQQRDGDAPSDSGEGFYTDLPTKFNPVTDQKPTGQQNCTMDNADVLAGDTSVSYPLFIDPGLPDTKTSFWTLSKAVRYILSIWNPANDDDDVDDGGPLFPGDSDGDSQGGSGDDTYQQFITNPDFDDLNDILENRKPTDGNEYYDPSDPSSYTADPIVIREFDATNMPWPDALNQLLGYHGFGMRWTCGQDGSGFPTNSFQVYRKDAGNENIPKQLYWPVVNTPLNPAYANVEELTGTFDYHGLANQFVIETHPNRYEVGVILAPGFTPAASDAVPAPSSAFWLENIDGATQEIQRKYRYYIADECGAGHWDFQLEEFVTDQPFDFTSIFPNIPDDAGGTTSSYVDRFRPGATKLLTSGSKVGSENEETRYNVQLAFSRDWTPTTTEDSNGSPPCLWDGKTGHWQPIARGSWELLDDRLGINFTGQNPNAIKIGKYSSANPQETSEILQGITSIALGENTDNPDVPLSQQYFHLRLTTVIESDQTLEATAARRMASPLPNTVQRRINAKDHFRKDLVTPSSPYFNVVTGDQAGSDIDDVTQVDTDAAGNFAVRDDTEAAEDHAAQLRSAHEFPALALACTIPGLSLAYDIGDRINEVVGRNISFQTNAGAEQDEAPAYPFVVSRTWSFSGDEQKTVLQLSDRRMQPQPVVGGRRHGRQGI